MNLVQSILSTSSKSKIVDPIRTNKKHYPEINPLNGFATVEKTKLLKSIDNYARKLDKRVKQVSASLSGEWQAIHILRKNGSISRGLQKKLLIKGNSPGRT